MSTPATMTHSLARRALLADLLLFSVAVVWGFNFTVIKDAIGRMDPMLYIMLRYFAALAIFVIVMPGALTKARRSDWRMGAVLGVFYLTALIVQTRRSAAHDARQEQLGHKAGGLEINLRQRVNHRATRISPVPCKSNPIRFKILTDSLSSSDVATCSVQ